MKKQTKIYNVHVVNLCGCWEGEERGSEEALFVFELGSKQDGMCSNASSCGMVSRSKCMYM